MEIKPLIYTTRMIRRSSKKFVEGEHEVRIRITQGQEKEFIPLRFSSSMANWDGNHGLPMPSHPYYKELSKKITQYLDNIHFELKLAERAERYLSCLELKRKVVCQDNSYKIQRGQLKILEYFDKVISDLEEAGNPGYADVFISTRATVSKFLNKYKSIPANQRDREKDKAFIAFEKEDHQRYEQFITAGSSESTISLYLRTYFRIWNLAISEGYCSKEHHPSNFIGFHAYKRIRTQKRSVKENYLQKIIKEKLSPGNRMFRSHKLLQFMYYGRGINFSDMCKLKWKDIVNGTIHYIRSKNHREYDYTLHPKALKVLKYFKNSSELSDAGYVFPILYSIHDTPRKIVTRIKSALKSFNSDLKEMAKAVGWERKFTSYSLRHSFATHLRNNDVNISIIKTALGHETEEQTVVYLDELDDQLVADKINRALIFKHDKARKSKKKNRHSKNDGRY